MNLQEDVLMLIDELKSSASSLHDEITQIKSMSQEVKDELLNDLNIVVVGALDDVKQSVINDPNSTYFFYPLITSCMILGQIYGKIGFSKSTSKLMSNYAKIRLLNDPKQKALAEIEQHYQESKTQFKRRGYTAQFIREMHDKYPIIESQKTIENLVSALNKENELIPR